MTRSPAILLMGPTGSGKTELAAALVARLPLEIVSVDAAMVYRGMDIGTAKPPPELLARAPHRLIDLIDPAESYSAARFLADAGAAMAEISAQGRVPLLVGGTMLYFRALQSGLAQLPPADPAIRQRLEARAAIEGWPALHAELASLDPATATRIGPNDRQRIQRALEVIEQSGRAAVRTAWGGPAGRDEPRGPSARARARGSCPAVRAHRDAVRRDAAARVRGRSARAARRAATCIPGSPRCG